MSKKRRCRHHVNPLNFRPEPAAPDWRKVFADPTRPLEIDIGSAKGTFLIARAQSAPERNVVGLEIRKPMVERAQRDADKAGLKNVFVIFGNANVDFARLFDEASVDRVYVHFPDPWFKKRHHKRRVVTPAFLDVLASRLKDGGEFHFQTDFIEYADEAGPAIEAHPCFENALGPGVRAPDPLVPGVLSDREAWHISQGDPVYRYLIRRRPRAVAPSPVIAPPVPQQPREPRPRRPRNP